MFMRFRLKIIPFCLLIQGHFTFAQDDSTNYQAEVVSSEWKDQGVSFGFEYAKYFYGELGYYRSNVYEIGGFPLISTTMNYGLEFSYFDNLVLAPKVQARFHAGIFNVSLSSVFYYDFSNSLAIKLRPEVGLGFYNFDLNYGYNLGIYKNGFVRTNRHTFCIRYFLRTKRKHLGEYDRQGNPVK